MDVIADHLDRLRRRLLSTAGRRRALAPGAPGRPVDRRRLAALGARLAAGRGRPRAAGPGDRRTRHTQPQTAAFNTLGHLLDAVVRVPVTAA